MIIGTSHFDSRFSANDYYAQYGYSAHDVGLKISSGEITIGRPKLSSGEPDYSAWTDSDGRYFIKTKKG